MNDARFIKARRLVFGIALASFVLSFFHRTAPAAIAGELTSSFSISSAVLGTLAATYFYVYTLLQMPVGVLADTLGPRRLLTGGAVIAGAGSLAVRAGADVGNRCSRTHAGRRRRGGRLHRDPQVAAVWFPPDRFATLTGVTMFAGNLGAVLAGAPLAWIVTQTSWRAVFVALALLSTAFGIATWMRVRDRPEQIGFAPVDTQPGAGN